MQGAAVQLFALYNQFVHLYIQDLAPALTDLLSDSVDAIRRALTVTFLSHVSPSDRHG